MNFLKGIEGLLMHPVNEAKWMWDETKKVVKNPKEITHVMGDHQRMMSKTITEPLGGHNVLTKNSDAIAGLIVGGAFAAAAGGGTAAGSAGSAGSTTLGGGAGVSGSSIGSGFGSAAYAPTTEFGQAAAAASPVSSASAYVPTTEFGAGASSGAGAGSSFSFSGGLPTMTTDIAQGAGWQGGSGLPGTWGTEGSKMSGMDMAKGALQSIAKNQGGDQQPRGSVPSNGISVGQAGKIFPDKSDYNIPMQLPTGPFSAMLNAGSVKFG